MDVLSPPASRFVPMVAEAEPDQLRGIFSGISLEMCRPLISLRAGFDLLLAGSEGPIPANQRDRVQFLRAQCDDLLRLTRTYLEYAGLTRGARPLDLIPYRLGALLDESDRRFAGKAAAREVRWLSATEGPDAEVVTDLGFFQRIVGHLVANALEHTPEGGAVELTGRVEGDSWSIVVSDTGRGIPEASIGSVFEPLVRLPGGEAEAVGGDGYGMGLAVCRELVTLLGGSINLRSAPGHGTVVTIRFPLGPSARAD